MTVSPWDRQEQEGYRTEEEGKRPLPPALPPRQPRPNGNIALALALAQTLAQTLALALAHTLALALARATAPQEHDAAFGKQEPSIEVT